MNLGEKAKKIAAKLPRVWEYALLAQVVIDEIGLAKLSLASGDDYLGLATIRDIDNPTRDKEEVLIEIEDFRKFSDETKLRLSEITQCGNELSALFSSPNTDAFGLPGMPGNADNIAVLAKKVSSLYYRVEIWRESLSLTSYRFSSGPLYSNIGSISFPAIEKLVQTFH